MPLALKAVDRAEVVILADNYCEQVILGSDRVTRPGGLTVKPGEEEVALKAEHGFSALVRLFVGEERHTVMLDAGRSGTVAVENARWVGVDLGEVEALVISHGHGDHRGGVARVAEQFTRPVPVILHPDAFLERYVKQPGGGMMRFSDFRPDLFAGTPLRFETHREPVPLAGGCAAATGEIPRRTAYEKGFPPQLAVREGRQVPDVEVWDDQAIVFVVQDQGAVIITGCGHAGVVNTVRYGLELTGAARPLAVIGGFHLCWPIPEEVVLQTLADLKALDPGFLVPCHCTGWSSTQRIAQEMPERFLLSTVGCTIRF
jgi:7,8-dihydropterin-6-yl-methyl-4-(beta-D-ribofuranosyl)aminobenzene 5'-phosphate synthase